MSEIILQKIHCHLAELPANPAFDAESMLCTTIEGEPDADGESFWIQLHAGQINFRHLDDPVKEEILGSILVEADAIADIEPGTYATFDLVSLSPGQVDSLILRLLVEYFDASDSSDPSISTEEL